MKITAKQLAERLNLDYVHAASFMKSLVSLGVAQKCDSIKTGKRGRATVIYELNDSDGIVQINLDLSMAEV
jgi:predicted ArsR family transcriptional regulator